MAVRREIAESAFLVKRISHAPIETHSFRPALHASRTTLHALRPGRGEVLFGKTDQVLKPRGILDRHIG
jgi:hypothetical protein